MAFYRQTEKNGSCIRRGDICLLYTSQSVEEERFDCSALQELRVLVVDDDLDVCENTVGMREEIGMCS